MTLFSLKEWGGAENWIFNIAQMLSQKHRVVVVSNGITYKSRIEQIPKHDFIYYEIPTLSFLSIKPSIILSQVPQWLNDFDIIYLYHNSLLYSYQVLALCNKPVILGIHSELLFASRSELRAKLHQILFNILSRKAARISCRNGNQVAFFERRIGVASEKVILERPFVNTSLYKPSNSKNHFTVLFVGRFVQGKGISTIQKSIYSSNRDIQWEFIGAGEEQIEYMINEMTKRFLNTSWKRFLVGQELANAYAQASVLINPSESEAFPNVVVESLASGTPVILSDIPAHRKLGEILPRDTFSFFSCGDSKELLEQVLAWKKLVEQNRPQYDLICSRARKFVELTFSETQGLASFESLLSQVIVK